MVGLVKLLVAFIKIQIFIAKLLANAEWLAELEARLEELEKEEDQTTE